MAAPADDASFPDLHHKMSKKIAQLTKVIYHLNTRNDDHDAELKALASQHESEIDGILKDAAAKISKFQEALGKQRDTVKASMTVTKLQARHEAEKRAALDEFAQYKEASAREVAKLQKQHADKVKGMSKELKRAKEAFADRVARFEEEAASLAANSSVSKQELAAMQKAHKDEVDGLVKKYNGKYNDMLRQRMDEEDKMRAELEAENKAACEGLSRKFEEQIRRLKEDYEARLAAAHSGSDENMARVREEHAAAMQRLIADLDASKSAHREAATQAEQLAARVDALERQLADTEAKLATTSASLAEMERAAGDGAQQSAKALSDREARIAKLHEANRDLKADLEATQKQLGDATRRAADLEDSLAAERARAGNAEEGAAEATASLTAKLLEAEMELSALKSKVQSLEKALDSRSSELDAARADADAAAAAHRKQTDKLNGEVSDLKARIAALQAEIKSTGSGAAEREDALRAELRAAKDDMRRSMEDARNAHKKALKDAEAAAAAKLKGASADKDAAVAKERAKWEKKLAERVAALEAEREELRAKLEADAAAALAKYQAEIEAELSASRAKMERMTTESERLKKEILAKNASQGQALKDAQHDVARLEKEVGQLEEKLAASREGEARSARMVESLKKQVEALRIEIQDVGKEAARKLQRELGEAEQRATKRLNDETSRIRQQSDAEKHKELAALRKEFEDRIRATEGDAAVTLARVQKELKQTSSELNEALQAADAAAREHAAALDKAQRDAAASLDRAVRDGEAARRAAVEDGELAVQRKSAEMNKIRERELAELRATHKDAMAALRDDHTKDVERLNAQHAAAMRKREDELRAEAAAAADKVRTRHEGEIKRLTQQLESERQAAEDRLKGDHERQVATLTAQLRDTTERLEQHTERADRAEEDLGETRRQLAAERDAMVRLKQEHAYALQAMNDSLNKTHREELDKLLDDHMAETKALQQQFANAQAMHEEQKKVLNARLAELEERFRNRESRPEDIQRIKKLAQLCAEKDALVKKTMEEMKYFKMELMNREENFNSKFSRTPNVGVMAVVKTKGGGGGGAVGGGKDDADSVGTSSVGGGSIAPAASFDIVLLSLWRNEFADGEAALRTAASLVTDGGSLVVFARGERGVHAIRHAFRKRLQPFLVSGCGAMDRAAISAALSGTMGSIHQEPLCSQIDLTPIMQPRMNDHVARTLSDLLGVDVKKACEAHPPLFESLMEEFREWTLTDDDRVIVYNPLLVTVATKGPSTSRLLAPRAVIAEAEALVTPGSRTQEAEAGSRIYDSVTDAWWPHGAKGGFCNAGLQSWRETREAWNERPAGFKRPPSPPPVPIEEVMEELAKLQRSYELPGPMRLPDIIDVYVDIWSCDVGF
uniref:Protein FAM184A/B N-terminal domain-containing protein n=1 Tax=Bicosoecida sp. CB-2014 TaxID=1486930 RepID=A0A7S1G7I8_9STRA